MYRISLKRAFYIEKNPADIISQPDKLSYQKFQKGGKSILAFSLRFISLAPLTKAGIKTKIFTNFVIWR